MKRILINATQQEELRVAIVDGQKLYNLDIEVPSREQKKSSVFKGKVTRVEPSLEACFVDFGAERHGFLPFKEITRSYWSESAKKAEGRPSIKEAIQPNQELIVQVEKEERGNKGAALTTKISLAGRYLVLMPTEARAGGVSRRIEGEDRAQVREAFNDVNKPDDMGAIVRTAGVGRSTEELQWDLDYLTSLWEAIDKAANEKPAPFLVYHDSSVIIRALRDHYDKEIGQIIIDNPEIYQQAEDFVRQTMPHNLRKLKLYQEPTPLFSRFQIESQIESAFQREVLLPSGGAIVIDHTEALTSIDVNSGRATKGSDIEETALHTNLEASEEIARQLRLRDLGGLFVIDFIDMIPSKNQREVESRLRQELKADRARVRSGRISRFGLMEMSRQRLRPSLGESSQEVCRICQGHGTVRSVESLSLSILRLLGEEGAKDQTGSVVVNLPVDIATFLLNEKRAEISEIEELHKIRVILVPDQNFERPNYRLERVRGSDQEHQSANASSFELVEKVDVEHIVSTEKPQPLSQQAAVQSVEVDSPVPPPQPAQSVAPPRAKEPEGPGLFVRIWKGLFNTGSEPAPTETAEAEAPAETKRQPRGRSQSQSRRRNNNERRNRSSRNRGGKQGGQKNTGDQKRKPANKATEKKTQSTDENKPNDSQNGGEEKAPQKKSSGRSRRRSNRRRTPRGRQQGRDNQNRENPSQDNQKTSEADGNRQQGRDSQNRGNPPQDNQKAPEADGNRQQGRDSQNRGNPPQDNQKATDADGNRQQGRNSQNRGNPRQDNQKATKADGGRQQGRNSQNRENPSQDNQKTTKAEGGTQGAKPSGKGEDGGKNDQSKKPDTSKPSGNTGNKEKSEAKAKPDTAAKSKAAPSSNEAVKAKDKQEKPAAKKTSSSKKPANKPAQTAKASASDSKPKSEAKATPADKPTPKADSKPMTDAKPAAAAPQPKAESKPAATQKPTAEKAAAATPGKSD